MKIRKPYAGGTPKGTGFRPPAYDRMQEAAIEKKKSEYIELVCGHLTTWDEDAVYSCWRPANKRKSFFCDKCGKWVNRKLHKKKNVLPDNPLF